MTTAAQEDPAHCTRYYVLCEKARQFAKQVNIPYNCALEFAINVLQTANESNEERRDVTRL